jgi:hypothetical protein
MVALAIAGCGAAPPQVDPRIKRDVLVTLDTERGELTAILDGGQTVHAGVNRAATLAADMREGEHTLIFRARPAQYEGMGFTVSVTADRTRAFRFYCSAPCDAAALRARVDAALEARGELADPCAVVEVKDLSLASARGADGRETHELTVKMNVLPPESPERRAARGCR